MCKKDDGDAEGWSGERMGRRVEWRKIAMEERL